MKEEIKISSNIILIFIQFLLELNLVVKYLHNKTGRLIPVLCFILLKFQNLSEY
jgi:hypothetical protein